MLMRKIMQISWVFKKKKKSSRRALSKVKYLMIYAEVLSFALVYKTSGYCNSLREIPRFYWSPFANWSFYWLTIMLQYHEDWLHFPSAFERSCKKNFLIGDSNLLFTFLCFHGIISAIKPSKSAHSIAVQKDWVVR